MRRPALGSVLSLLSIGVVAVLSVAYLLFGVARVDWFEQRDSAVMLIPDAANLVPHSPILLSGVKVGRITSVRNIADGVQVRFDIDSGRRIPADSTVVIETLSALGEPYVDFRSPTGSGPYLADGQLVHTQAIRTPRSIPEVARTVTELLRQLDPQALAGLVTTFSQAMAGTDAVVPELTHATDLLASTLIARIPSIRALLTDAQVPGPDIAQAGADMADGGPQLDQFGIKVQQVVDSLQDLLNARPVPEAYSEGSGLLPFLNKVDAYIGRIGPDAQRLYPVIGPLIERGGNSVQGLDLSALISQAVNSVSPDGRIRLQITPR
ncbi:MlaD family protein [Nocardia jejuensis]|uniref:MlaD family protein n=1 Tax=Nocardia jejuensis TaxID=328049 RepID=UPI00082A2EE6|nr:MlaD family protein [Nocardia jejuensis]